MTNLREWCVAFLLIALTIVSGIAIAQQVEGRKNVEPISNSDSVHVHGQGATFVRWTGEGLQINDERGAAVLTISPKGAVKWGTTLSSDEATQRAAKAFAALMQQYPPCTAK